MQSIQRRRRGSTLVEQLVALTLLGILLAVAVKSSAYLADRAATRAAGRDAADAFAAARDQAIATNARTAVRVSEQNGTLAVHRGTDTLMRLHLGAQHRVNVHATRDSMAYSSLGLGWGAANLRLILTRGAAAETLTVSRLGRVKRG